MPENRRPQRPTGKKPPPLGGKAAPGAATARRAKARSSGRPERAARTAARTDAARPRAGQRTKDQQAYDGPDLPEGITGDELDRSVTAQLKGLPEKLAARVAQHLAAAGLYIDQDPELAYRHALAARARAPRLAVVREAAGEAAYAAGHYAEALADLRAAKRMNGATAYLPIMADCHRALGQPDQAVKLAKSPSVASFPPAAKAEMTIVEAGARRDMGQVDAALRILEQAPLTSKSREPWVVRLRYAYADALEEAGRDGTRWRGSTAPRPSTPTRSPTPPSAPPPWRSTPAPSDTSAGEDADQRPGAGVLGGPLQAVAVGDPDPVDLDHAGRVADDLEHDRVAALEVGALGRAELLAEALRRRGHVHRAAVADVRHDGDLGGGGREDVHPREVQGAVEVGRGAEDADVDRLADRRRTRSPCVSRCGQGSGWVLTQPITASSRTSTTAYAVIRQPRRDGATASEPARAGSGVTDVMAGG